MIIYLCKKNIACANQAVEKNGVEYNHQLAFDSEKMYSANFSTKAKG
jgi:hypothetical protein